MFDIIFHSPPEGWVEVVVGQPEAPQSRAFVPAAELGGSHSWPDDQDVYFSPALRREQASTKEAVLATRVLWADVDVEREPKPVLPASITVWTGHGWHLYWVLKDWCYDAEQVERANQILGADVGADHCWNINRLLRSPGTNNWKNGSSVPCSIRKLLPCVYTIDECLRLDALPSNIRHKIRTGDRRGHKSRSERDFSVVRQLGRVGISDSSIRYIFSYHKVGDKFREPAEGDDYLHRTLAATQEGAKLEAGGKSGSEIVVEDDGYYAVRGKARRRLSTFTLEPTLLLEGDNMDAVVSNVSAMGYKWPGVVFTRAAFTGRSALDKECRIAAWQWLGRDDDVRELLPFLLERLKSKGLPKVRATSVLGLHQQSGAYWYVGRSTTVGQDGVLDRESAPLVYLDTKREHPAVDFHVTQPTESDLPQGERISGGDLESGSIQEINSLLPMLNAPSTIWPVIGWYCAAPFKPELERLGFRFPILNIFGTKGSGKTTTLLRVFQPLFCNTEPKSYDANTTRFVSLSLLGSSNCFPVCFSEFRQGTADKFLRYVLLSYDTGSDPRGRADQTTVDYPLLAPFSVDGEDQIADPACKERMIAVQFHPNDIQEGSDAWKARYKIQEYEKDFNKWGTLYLQFCLEQLTQGALPGLLATVSSVISSTFPFTLPDRVRRNLVICGLGLEMFAKWSGRTGFDPLVLQTSLNLVYNSKLGRPPTLADEFIEDLVNHLSVGRVLDIPWSTKDGILYFQYAPAFSWWLKHRRSTEQARLAKDSIRAQLYETEYIKPPTSVRGYWMFGIDIAAAHAAGLDIKANIIKPTIKEGVEW